MSQLSDALGVYGDEPEDRVDEEPKEKGAATPPGVLDYVPVAIYPRDSILEPFLNHAAGICETPPHIILGCLLPVCAAILQRNVSVMFDRRKYTNLFSMVVAPPSRRKGSAVSLVSRLGREILGSENLIIGSSMSEEALFEIYEEIPDRLWIESEGNALLFNWAKSVYGEHVSRRALKLYDCESWNQRFKGGKDKSEAKHIPETCTSLLIATTFSGCRFNGLAAADGLRRRFLYYVAADRGSRIYWPHHGRPEDWERIVKLFRSMARIKGEFPALDQSHMLFMRWRAIQDEIDAKMTAALGATLEAEAIGHALSEAASHVLKIAMIFQVCRHLADKSRPETDWEAESLQLAFDHVMQCVDAQAFIGKYALRFSTAEEAEAVFSTVVAEAPEEAGKAILRSKTALTGRFASHPGRAGAMKPSDLHGRIMPFLIADGRVSIAKEEGRLVIYSFRPPEAQADTSAGGVCR